MQQKERSAENVTFCIVASLRMYAPETLSDQKIAHVVPPTCVPAAYVLSSTVQISRHEIILLSLSREEGELIPVESPWNILPVPHSPTKKSAR